MRSGNGCSRPSSASSPILVGYLVVLVVLGCFLDSVSIMLIVLPFVIPVFDGFGVNLVWLGLISIIAIEIGLLTPPLGVAVFVVKANLEDQRITTWEIFMGTMPMTITMTVVLVDLRAVSLAVAGAGRPALELVVAGAGRPAPTVPPAHSARSRGPP